jgi:tetratricopeptide (TPR) repeat protein
LAAKAFENAIQIQPTYVDAWAYLGEAQQHLSPYIDPYLTLSKALALDSDSVAANIFMSLYYERNDDLEKAYAHLNTALSIDQGNPAYLMQIGKLFALRGDLQAGKEYYWQALDQSDYDPSYIREFLTFSLQFNLDLRDVALPMARQLLSQEPMNPISLDLMGEILLNLGDTLNAERFFLRSLENDPGYPRAHLHLGRLYQSQGKSDLASYHLNMIE